MASYSTPDAVATALSRHAPRRIRRLLDPAVGLGVLVESLASRIVACDGEVLCIDVSAEALAACRKRLDGKTIRAKFLNADFLNWAAGRERFDCIIMNPPFAGKKGDHVQLNSTRSLLDYAAPSEVSSEVAFVIKAIDLLDHGGRLLAVLPSSVVSSQGSIWLRRYLREMGQIRYVHELPHFTFSDLESRVYLFVFEKGGQSLAVTLLNHDLHRPSSIRVVSSRLGSELRLDFGFHFFAASIRKIKSRTSNLGWETLGECVKIFGGRGESPTDLDRSLHTTDFSDRSWTFVKKSTEIDQDFSDRGLRRGDLILKRVVAGVHERSS
jgi:tRNA1(Val) A37 N6-methylase TrmN6